MVTQKTKEALAEALNRVSELEAQAEYEDTIQPDQLFAIELHETNCHHNHTDGCSWFYEMDNGQHRWTGWTHERHLRAAQSLMTFTTFEEVSKIMKMVRDL